MQCLATSSSKLAVRTPVRGAGTVAKASTRPMWLPGSAPPAHLDGTLPGDFGYDPLGLGANKEMLSWFAEAERVHARWAMLAVAGIIAQEVVKPEIFWYDAPTKIELPFGIVGLLAAEFWMMHFVEIKRWQDFWQPGSADQDPLFPANKLGAHEVGYPGITLFAPGDIATLKVKEIKNGRLAMLAFVGMTMTAQFTGKGPLANLADHIADPTGTTIFSKAVIVPGAAFGPTCAIPSSVVFEGVTIPTPCFLESLWP
eukprot:gene29602-17879_t